MAISFVGSASSGITSSSTSYTISRPDGLITGDFLIASVAVRLPSSSAITITPPPGWSKVTDVTIGGTYAHQMAILRRTATASEPATWTGALSTSVSMHAWVIGAYRGVSGIAVYDKNTSGAATVMGTIPGTLENPDNGNWELVIPSCRASNGAYEFDVSFERIRESGIAESSSATQVALFDSLGAKVAGTYSARGVSRGAAWQSCLAFECFLAASTNVVSGTLDVSPLPLPVPSLDAQQGSTGTMTAVIPAVPSFDNWTGTPSPPDGTLGALVTPVVDMSATEEPRGPLAADIPISMSCVAETRRFGIRTVIVEREQRGYLILTENGADVSRWEDQEFIGREVTLDVVLPFITAVFSSTALVGTEPITSFGFPLPPVFALATLPGSAATSGTAYNMTSGAGSLAELAALVSSVASGSTAGVSPAAEAAQGAVAVATDAVARGGAAAESAAAPVTVYGATVESHSIIAVPAVTNDAMAKLLVNAESVVARAGNQVTMANAGEVLVTCHN